MAAVKILLDVDDLVKKYLGGMSELELSKKLAVSRTIIRTRLIGAGIKRRTQSEANFVMSAKMTRAQRLARTKAAHDAVRGTHKSFEARCSNAKTRENLKHNISPVEDELAKFFNQVGFSVTQQKAVGPYNLDIALEEGRIAVEVFGGYFHGYGHHKSRFFDRTKYILDNGWAVVIVWVEAKRHPITVDGRKHLLSICKLFRRNPSMLGRYRVIWGDGQDVPALGRYFYDEAEIGRAHV